MDHAPPYAVTHLQLHDDIAPFGHAPPPPPPHSHPHTHSHSHPHSSHALLGVDDYAAPDAGGGYYGYYADFPHGAQAHGQAHKKAAKPHAPAKRPLRPAPPQFPVSAPSAASSHVRTLPAKATNASATSGSGGAAQGFGAVANQSAFINKLYTMLEEADPALISWDHTGTFFIVKNTTDFSKTVLPLYFKHNNFASFVRQLNMYGFHKINDSFFKLNNTCSEVWEFKHHDFRRGEFALLSNIKRKAPKSNSSSSSNTGGTGLPKASLVKQQHQYQLQQQQQLLQQQQQQLQQGYPHAAGGAGGSSIASSPLCMMTTPGGLDPTSSGSRVGGGGGGIKMDSCGDLNAFYSGSGGGNTNAPTMMIKDDRVDELVSRVYDLEGKLATLSESYELVCNQALSCKKELSGYSDVMTHVVSLLATMAQKDESAIQAQLNNLAKASLEHLNNSSEDDHHSSSGYNTNHPPRNSTTTSTTSAAAAATSTTTIKKNKRKRQNSSDDDLDAELEESEDGDAFDGEEEHHNNNADDFKEEDEIKEEEDKEEEGTTIEEEDEDDDDDNVPIAKTSVKINRKKLNSQNNSNKKVKANILSLMTPPIGNPTSKAKKSRVTGK